MDERNRIHNKIATGMNAFNIVSFLLSAFLRTIGTTLLMVLLSMQLKTYQLSST